MAQFKSSFSTAHGACAVQSSAGKGPSQKTAQSNPIDLVFLSRQTLCDRELEREVLSLFKSQSQLYMNRLKMAKTQDERKMAAHTILGSARGIGAWRVVEQVEQIHPETAHLNDISELQGAVDSANAYIEELLN